MIDQSRAAPLHLVPAKFVERMTECPGSFCLVLMNGSNVYITRITDVRMGMDQTIWLDVILKNGGGWATVNAGHVSAAYEQE